jgi:hypothetical protein
LLRAASLRLSEQRVRSGTVGGGPVTVRGDAGDFGFEQCDPFGKLGLRIGAEVFAREATRRVSTGAWAIGFFHRRAASAPSGLLSIGEAVIRIFEDTRG